MDLTWTCLLTIEPVLAVAAAEVVVAAATVVTALAVVEAAATVVVDEATAAATAGTAPLACPETPTGRGGGCISDEENSVAPAPLPGVPVPAAAPVACAVVTCGAINCCGDGGYFSIKHFFSLKFKQDLHFLMVLLSLLLFNAFVRHIRLTGSHLYFITVKILLDNLV